MDSTRNNKTQKRSAADNAHTDKEDTFKALLEDSAREAYSRQWHRLERGLRLNRLRIFIEDIAPVYNMTKEEKEGLFLYLQKSLDKKLLNTHKIVQYDQNLQKIIAIRNLEIKRGTDNTLKWGFSIKKPKQDITRKKKKTDEVLQTNTTSLNSSD